MNYNETYNEWLTNPFFDEATKAELKAVEGNEEEIKDRFYKTLEFGTGGLRGVIGAGTNRMNYYTVGKATQGLANFILKENGASKGVAIAYDSRRMSPEFALCAALCLCANGIKTYLFESLRPTPVLSYTVRKLGCISGIVVTASHNPPEYNGYKVYWEDGAQVTAPKDKQIIEEVNKITDFAKVLTMDKETALNKGLLTIVGKEIDDTYIAELKKLVVNPEMVKEVGKSMKVVYTPLHGTGNIPARRILKEIGFENVYVVKEQELPDGNFPTVSYPNPEDKKAFTLALKLAKEVDADLVLATDPDADRLGVFAKDSRTGEYVSFTGNMSGICIMEYLLSQRKAQGKLREDSAVVKTIVSTNMADKVTENYGVNLIEVLTGFKYIGEQIKWFEERGKGQYEFGFEESYGCLVGTHARDKDAIVAVMALCEVAAYLYTKNMTLYDFMLSLYEKYGYFIEGLETLTLKGADGQAKIASIIDGLRQNPPKELAGLKVKALRDYDKNVITDLASGATKETGLPKSNVLYFDLEQDAWVCVRPSGTEPKIKFYIGVKGNTLEAAKDIQAKLTEELMSLVK
ncbi:MAG: phospho-sugar mutase [Lachnospiraceae bacterium]|nr:phospho-sugar mutase [Lachnospiraceae bacterium]